MEVDMEEVVGGINALVVEQVAASRARAPVYDFIVKM
jgi:hypothetical protein